MESAPWPRRSSKFFSVSFPATYQRRYTAYAFFYGSAGRRRRPGVIAGRLRPLCGGQRRPSRSAAIPLWPSPGAPATDGQGLPWFGRRADRRFSGGPARVVPCRRTECRDPPDPGRPDRLRHGQPEFQPGADRLRPRPAGRDWRRQRADPRRRGAQGEPLRHHRAQGPQRHRLVRPHRRRAGRRSDLGERPVRAARSRRQAVRPRHRRHEGVPGRRARPRPRVRRRQA